MLVSPSSFRGFDDSVFLGYGWDALRHQGKIQQQASMLAQQQAEIERLHRENQELRDANIHLHRVHGDLVATGRRLNHRAPFVDGHTVTHTATTHA